MACSGGSGHALSQRGAKEGPPGRGRALGHSRACKGEVRSGAALAGEGKVRGRV